MSENNVHCFQKNSNTKSPVPLILRKNIEHFQSGIENIGETNKEEKEIVDIIDETSSTLVNKISFHQSPEVVDLVECKEIQQEETIVSLESGVIKSTEV